MNTNEEAALGAFMLFGVITWLLVIMALVKYVYT